VPSKSSKTVVKEEQRRLVALNYPGKKAPHVDTFKDDLVVFDGLIRFLNNDTCTEQAVRSKIACKLKQKRAFFCGPSVSHADQKILTLLKLPISATPPGSAGVERDLAEIFHDDSDSEKWLEVSCPSVTNIRNLQARCYLCTSEYELHGIQGKYFSKSMICNVINMY